MKFTASTVLAFAAAALAKPILLNSNYQITEGEPFTLTWSDAQGPVSVSLMTGDPDNLKEVTVLTTGVTDNEYTFTLNDLPSGTYAIRVSDSTGPNYSPQFEYTGTGTVSSTTLSTRSSTASSSRTSSSSSSTETETTSTETESTSTTSTESTSTTTLSTTTTREPTTTERETPTSTPDNTNAGQRFSSPLALVLVTVAAFVFFN